MKGKKLALLVLLALVLAPFAFAQAPTPITIMTRTFSGDPCKDDSPVKLAVESYCNVKLNIIWAPSNTYADKFNLTLASGDLPQVMMSDSKSASVIKAAKDGAFWDIGPYFRDPAFKNLSSLSPVTEWNASFEGITYALPSTRPLGRNGVLYRGDWLKKVGLPVPKTIDDFYNMLVAFRDKDPDGNGKADTYGMVVPQFKGPFLIMLTWFGAPNGWGEDATGNLIPTFYTKEYMDCLRFWKKMYDEKLINDDFPVYDNNKWDNPIVQNKAGCRIDVINNNTINSALVKADPNTTAFMDVTGGIAGPKGVRSMATTGFGSLYVFAKQTIKDVAMLKKILAFEDKLGDDPMLDLMNYGIEGQMYTRENGFIRTIANHTVPKNLFNDINQIPPYISATNGTPRELTWFQAKYEKVMKENEKIVVGDPTLAFVSDTYKKKGTQLDNMIEDARVKYIVGQIDEKAFLDAVELWKKSGGEDVLKEYNADYKKFKGK